MKVSKEEWPEDNKQVHREEKFLAKGIVLEESMSNDDLTRDRDRDRVEAREAVIACTVYMELEFLEEVEVKGWCIAEVLLINLRGKYLMVPHILETVEEKVV